MNDIITKAAEVFWSTDTSGKGHAARGRAFHQALNTLVEQGLNKTEARKQIAQEVQDNAPAHSKKFGASTVSQYNASWEIMTHENSPHGVTALNGELYAVVHKAYAGSMGAERISAILWNTNDPEKAAEEIAALRREDKDSDPDKEPKTRQYGIVQALRALVRIQEHEWTEDEKQQLFESALVVTVHVQPAAKEDGE